MGEGMSVPSAVHSTKKHRPSAGKGSGNQQLKATKYSPHALLYCKWLDEPEIRYLKTTTTIRNTYTAPAT